MVVDHAFRFLFIHDLIDNLFYLHRNRLTTSEFRIARSYAFDAWAEFAGAQLVV
jgi:hypothetical protein